MTPPVPPSIRLDDIDVAFPLATHGSLKQLLVGRRRQEARTRWRRALKGVSLRVDAPQKIGLVGRNGGGKTTLLRVIAGGLAPLSGRRRVTGRMASIISAGVGFDPMLPVRENIRLAMALSGRLNECSEDYIGRVLDFIELDGADAQQPLATLSLGFQSRLAFAVGLFQAPEIFLLDEIFSAGDAIFVKKARAAMKERMAASPIAIFASHIEEQLLETCERGVWLHDGRVMADGPIRDVLKDYGAMPDR